MLTEIFSKPKPILGPVQLLPLPGSSAWSGNWDRLIARAEQEAAALATGGVDGIIVENRYDGPFSALPDERLDPAAAIAMALLVRRLSQLTGLPVGVSVLQNDPETALAIAVNTDAAFIRIAVPAGARMTEAGLLNSRFHALRHYQKRLNALLPPIFADISLEHVVPSVRTAFVSDSGLSGSADERLSHLLNVARLLPRLPGMAAVLTDADLSPGELPAFQQAIGLPVVLECRQRPDDLDAYFSAANALLLSGFIHKGRSLEPDSLPTIDMTRVEEIVNRLRGVKSVQEMDPDIFLQRCPADSNPSAQCSERS